MSNFEFKENIVVDGQNVFVDSDNLEFSEYTLGDYIQREGPMYNYFGGQLVKAERELAKAEREHEKIFSEKFCFYKESKKASVELAKCNANADEAVISAQEYADNCKYKVRVLQQHLKAFDKNHNNAQSLGHQLRKEMDKLGSDIKFGNNTTTNLSDDVLEQIGKVVGEIESE